LLAVAASTAGAVDAACLGDFCRPDYPSREGVFSVNFAFSLGLQKLVNS
jgi:hypothetical protein